ncbi:hypothetical protein HPB49_001316 [Dermacentor silvarum]|uniref:Uncharacterized protein n=1 Tax=Dermacentor silvarum TaxID=543639 RepID=A0ACB8D9B7_DERSI|nr:hypothetical protein HPB49_001316 [Dermacentor silvarum]
MSSVQMLNHYQRLRDPQLKVWVLAEANGTIVTAHCTCMAGLGEACSHIGATLFAVETAVRIRDARRRNRAAGSRDTMTSPQYELSDLMELANICSRARESSGLAASAASPTNVGRANTYCTTAPATNVGVPDPAHLTNTPAFFGGLPNSSVGEILVPSMRAAPSTQRITAAVPGAPFRTAKNLRPPHASPEHRKISVYTTQGPTQTRSCP